jgi:uncharacterized membrane protein YkvA (DUF1232 family)
MNPYFVGRVTLLRYQNQHKLFKELEMVDKNKTTKKPAKTATQKAKPTKKQIAEAVEKTKSKAEEYARDPKKAKKLLEDAVKKAKGFEKNRGPLGEVWSYLTALFRLLRAYIGGEYRDIPWGSIVLVTVGIVYFVSPIDLIPDVLPGIGFIDDAAVIAFVVGQIKADLDNFLAWEIIQAEAEDDEPALTE